MQRDLSAVALKHRLLGRTRRDLAAQYLVDHISVYRCGQNLPYKFSDP
jgi:hypothetical protein